MQDILSIQNRIEFVIEQFTGDFTSLRRYVADSTDLPPIALPLIISDSRPVEAWA
jgi:hypothetical protein